MVEPFETIVAVVDCFGIQIIPANSVTDIGQFDEQPAGSACWFKNATDSAATMLLKASFEEVDLRFPVRPKQQVVISRVVIDTGFEVFSEIRHKRAFNVGKLQP